MVEQLFAYRLMDIGRNADVLITVGYPAFVIEHPQKEVFFFLWNLRYMNCGGQNMVRVKMLPILHCREQILGIEMRALSEAAHIFAPPIR